TSTPSDTSTFSATATDSPQNTSTDSPTDTPSDTDSPTRTASPTDTPSLTATLSSSPSRTDTPSATYTATRTDSPTETESSTPTDSPTRTDSPTHTLTLTETQTFTETATPVPEPYQVVVNIYNSAGELVRSLYNGTSEDSAGQAQVLETANPGGGMQVDITGLNGNAGANLVWNANNNGGQPVASGIYTVQITSTNSFGQTQAQSKAVSVVAVAGLATLEIYNSAGELVANLSAALNGLTSVPTGVSLVLPNGQNGVLSSSNPAQSGMGIKLTFADGSTETVPWNGLSTQGQPLQPGNYVLTLAQSGPGSGTVLKSQPFVILEGSDNSAAEMAQSALVVPNPVDGSWFTVQYKPSGTDTAVANLYDLAGQLVAQGAPEGAGTLRVSGNWSAGVYLLDFEVHDGSTGVLARRVLKVAIVR
ncbi:MAG TPA: T9SS type A sorting domain-containing protein, partial [bacterium]|nr:T9SS type A sorting domain-containing protein [bacterium]